MEELRIKRLLGIYLPVFNDHQAIEGDFDLIIDENQAIKNTFFIYWCSLWNDRRNELSNLLKAKL